MSLRQTAALLALIVLLGAAPPARAADPVPLAAHRAAYRLALEGIRDADVAAAGGSMAFEITDACDGWATRQRLQMTITHRDGQDIEMVSDYATWESKDGTQMRFRMRQTTDTAVQEQVEGDASLERAGGPGTIRYTMPEAKELPIPAGTTFPMAHTAAIVAAAERGQRFVLIPIFDGTSAKGVQDSSVVINAWGVQPAAPDPALAAMPSGRVRLAFYERDKAAQKPDYEVGMRYWANGVADDLQMDFTDFVMRGKLTDFALTPPHC